MIRGSLFALMLVAALAVSADEVRRVRGLDGARTPAQQRTESAIGSNLQSRVSGRIVERRGNGDVVVETRDYPGGAVVISGYQKSAYVGAAVRDQAVSPAGVAHGGRLGQDRGYLYRVAPDAGRARDLRMESSRDLGSPR